MNGQTIEQQANETFSFQNEGTQCTQQTHKMAPPPIFSSIPQKDINERQTRVGAHSIAALAKCFLPFLYTKRLAAVVRCAFY